MCKTLKQIILPEGINIIEDWAFCACWQLMHINLPDTIEYINSEAFLSCRGLKEITLPPGIKEIGEEVFRGCSKTTDLTYIEKPESDKCEKIVFIPDGSKGLVIRCYKNSVAHKYALENNLDFKLMTV